MSTDMRLFNADDLPGPIHGPSIPTGRLPFDLFHGLDLGPALSTAAEMSDRWDLAYRQCCHGCAHDADGACPVLVEGLPPLTVNGPNHWADDWRAHCTTRTTYPPTETTAT